jgi:methanethiol S-methyltransferase
MKYLFIILMWTGYCSLHSYLISVRFSNWMAHLLKDCYAFYRVFYVLISIALLIPVLHYSNQWASAVIITYDPPWSIIRYVLMYASLLLFFKAFFFDYDSLHFFGIRQILNLRSSPANQKNGIKKSGLLGIVRHPMYIALIVYLWCQTFRLTDVLVNALLTIYVYIGTLLEERKLILEFGDEYIQYQKEVPMLIPFLKFR